MHIRRTFTALTAAALLLAATALPAAAADTTTTFELTAGGLTISAPASATLGTRAATAGTVANTLGIVTVTDDRGALLASWSASAASTGFVNGTTTIAATAISYDAGLGTIVSGTPVLTPQVLVTDLSTAKTVMTATAVGSNAGSWNPTVSVAIPAGAVVGTYTATITHSVS